MTESSHPFVKNKWSCFFNTNFEFLLHRLDIDTLLVGGVSTCICVETTVRDAYMRDYDVIVVEECVAHYDGNAHRSTLNFIDRFAGKVASLDEVRGMFQSSAQTASAR